MSEEKKISPEEAKEVLEQEQKEKVDACAKEIQDALEKYGMELKLSPINIDISPKQ